MIISCPYCQTRYQVANDAIGSVGRKVQCANCQKAWQAMPDAPKPKFKVVPPSSPEDDRLFDDIAEEGLDEAFAAEEQSLAGKIEAAAEALRQQATAKTIDEIKSVLSDGKEPPVPAEPVAPAKPVDQALLRKRQRAFSQRRHSLARSLPLARVQRALRLGGAVALVLALGAGIALRTEIVRFAPDLAGLYSAIGLGVNVVGLDFRDMHTVRILRDGKEVMVVTATLYPVTDRAVTVPHVIVTLLDDKGRPLYEWSAASQARDLAPGEIVAFETQLAAPPANTARVRLSFANGRAQSAAPAEVPAAEAAAPSPKAAPTEPAPADAGHAPQSTH